MSKSTNHHQTEVLSGIRLKRFQRENVKTANWKMEDLRAMCTNLVRQILEEEQHPKDSSSHTILFLKREVEKIVRRARIVGKQREIPHFRYLEVRKELKKKAQG